MSGSSGRPSGPSGQGTLGGLPPSDDDDAWRWLEELLAGSGTALVLCDPDGLVLAAAGRSETRLGRQVAVGRSLREVLGEESGAELASALAATGADGRPRRVWLTTAGSTHLVSMAAQAFGASRSGDQPTLVLTVQDALEEAQPGPTAGPRLHDPATGLPSEALLVDRLQHGLSRTARDGTSVAVLSVETPDLSPVLDALGAARGAELLRAVARRVRHCVRSGDTAARKGHDGFWVLLERLTSSAPAVEVAHRVVEALQAPVQLHEGTEVRVRAHVGVAVGRSAASAPDVDGHDDEEVSGQELLRRADIAAQRSVVAGAGSVLVFDPCMHDGLLDRLQVASELRRALERDELVLHFQPLVDLDSGRVAGVEALLRWRHPQRGLVPPASFVPLAEETGLVVELGAWVLRRACAAAASELACGGPPVPVAVNVSGRQVQQRLVGDVMSALAESGLPPQALTLEITESALVDAEDAGEVLQQLRDLGVRTAVDDFGTGYASLAYLSRLPLDILKVDRSFVAAISSGGHHASLAEAVVGLGHRLGLEVVAEGIEEADQLQALQSVGCRLGQGYLFSRPVPSEGLDRVMSGVYPVTPVPAPRSGAAR